MSVEGFTAIILGVCKFCADIRVDVANVLQILQLWVHVLSKIWSFVSVHVSEWSWHCLFSDLWLVLTSSFDRGVSLLSYTLQGIFKDL